MFLALLGLTISATRSHAAPPPPAPKPNIVFFLADDLGYMDIAANNPKTFYHTPRIDSIAASGMRFTSGYAACPVCSPTRASIMTGKYPTRTGITDFIGGWRSAKLLPATNQNHLALEEVTLAEALRDAGYTNFFAGKWHLGNGEYTPRAQGFSADLTGTQQFFYPPSSQPPPDPKDDPKTTDRIANEAVRFIEANADKPFFAYLPFPAVHVPIGARQDLVEKYRQKPAPPVAWGQERQSKVRLVQSDPVYAAMIEQLDSAIGRVLDTLERRHLGARTIVVFMSDNGGLSTAEGHYTSNLPLRGGKGWPYEGGIREPWFIRAPGVTRTGSLCDVPVVSTDFYPTLLALAGLPLKPEQHRDGVSLLPLLRGGSLQRGPLFWHYPHYGNQGGAPCGAIRDGDWKLIEWYEDSHLELFNLRDDLGEQHDLAQAKPEKAKELQAKLVAWRTSVSALMPTPNPDYNGQPTTRPKNKKKAKQ